MPKLTKRHLDSLPEATKDTLIFDDELPGFAVRLKPGGARTFVVRYRCDGRQRSYAICKVGVMTPEEARKEARRLLGDIARGEDPSAARQDDRRAATVAQLAADYLDRHAIPNKRASSAKKDRAMIDMHILPALGRLRVDGVTRRDIEALHIGLSSTPYQANRLLALLSKMFSLAVAWGWRSDNPAKGIPRYQEDKRTTWLPEADLARLWAILEASPNRVSAAAIRMLILTGARKSEVLTMRWEDIDFDRGVWTKPSHHTKQKRTERLPLSTAALALLDGMTPPDRRDGVVFPGRDGLTAITEIKKAWASFTRDAKLPGLRMHDLRHTYASQLVSGGVPLHTVGRLLGHTQAQTTHRYAHLADAPLRDATEAMAKRLRG